jgi:hypothetical protein
MTACVMPAQVRVGTFNGAREQVSETVLDVCVLAVSPLDGGMLLWIARKEGGC